MSRPVNEVMQEIIYAAVVDALAALKTGSKGVPNTLLRDINAIHVNSTFGDLPRELQDAITSSVRAAFTRLLKEGYSVSTGQPSPPRREAQIPPRGPRPPHRGGPRRDGPGPRPPRGGNRADRGSKPRGR